MGNFFYKAPSTFALCADFCKNDFPQCKSFRYSYYSDADSQYCEFFPAYAETYFISDSSQPDLHLHLHRYRRSVYYHVRICNYGNNNTLIYKHQNNHVRICEYANNDAFIYKHQNNHVRISHYTDIDHDRDRHTSDYTDEDTDKDTDYTIHGHRRSCDPGRTRTNGICDPIQDFDNHVPAENHVPADNHVPTDNYDSQTDLHVTNDNKNHKVLAMSLPVSVSRMLHSCL
ncbi:hypothetical protein P171DRAFT_490550 [Karstenula rhodostoma CBS 690.94]|uniref:Uncharacterized protein n=1 Tax=Karstenula rhodostoma CBS 690.94 TaxID=1392251 RepID=A0A9P4U5J2_9PLEO|nr:hypothetical protein P171DRAFT_490550 [Karstenula rhodostoma CBS 690.94]